MTLQLGRVVLRSPLRPLTWTQRNVLDSGRSPTGFTNPTRDGSGDRVYATKGFENDSFVGTREPQFRLEADRFGSVYLRLDDPVMTLPEGYYALEDASFERTANLGRWKATLCATPAAPLVVRQAQNDAITGTVTADPTSDEDSKLVYTPTAGEVAVLRDRKRRILNGGFDIYTASPGAPDAWTSLGGAGVTLAKETSITKFPGPGTVAGFALKVTSGGTTGQGVKQTISPLATGEVIVAECWARTSGAANEQATLQIYNVTDATVAASVDGTVSATTWQRLQTAAVTAIAGKTYEVRVLQKENTAAGRITYHDEVQVYAYSSTGPTQQTPEPLNLPAGAYRVIARAQMVTTFTAKLRIKLLDPAGTALTTGAQVLATAAGAWQDFDLGTVTVPAANDGWNAYELTVQDPTNVNPVWLDRVYFLPA